MIKRKKEACLSKDSETSLKTHIYKFTFYFAIRTKKKEPRSFTKFLFKNLRDPSKIY
jgi:hypothetical protein